MDEINIQCPYCLEAITILLDYSFDGLHQIVEDCEVCCRPIEIDYTVQNNEIVTIDYNPIDGNAF